MTFKFLLLVPSFGMVIGAVAFGLWQMLVEPKVISSGKSPARPA
jgi:hypothetical protein